MDDLLRLSLYNTHKQAITHPDGRVRIPCPPCKNTIITPSPHRPHVLASECILLWTTPHRLNFQNELLQLLPNSLVLKIFLVMIQSLDEDTCSNYGASLLHFMQFCDSHNFPESECMPASASLLAAFLANAAGTISNSTANSWMAGLHYWHAVNGATWFGTESDVLHHIRRGITKLTPPSSKRACCPPVTLDTLGQLAQGLDLTNSFNIAIFAVACVAFWSCCHLGELLIPSPNVFDLIKHISHSILLISVHNSHNVCCTTFHIPWTKTTGMEGADISITECSHSTCPLAAIILHLKSNLNIPAHAPLFSSETANGSWSPLTKPWFLSCCNDIWVVAGHPTMPGHAFCIGRATELFLEGVHPDIVAMQGRWKSRAFLEYWCQIESILPLFISTAINSPLAISHLESTMLNFQCSHSLPNTALSHI
ncbi:uncharacterized protein BJ212DRAFT_1278216 [Suillus subaureus]|uniref:Uncharacterized protein n=1 Tax=Suillus subaureus TaxID=48587 RepID=A0A9P7E558_9AGAM|nr:uncharacterized protein BJ212DRAFT_1278216 [Suillus subaureus]KAG1811118.1 hypothetical protein BJ212DRAFT_1278216 [Suillus subaureus]